MNSNPIFRLFFFNQRENFVFHLIIYQALLLPKQGKSRLFEDFKGTKSLAVLNRALIGQQELMI